MATWVVGSGGNFATIADAMASPTVHAGDTIQLFNNYSNELPTVTLDNLTFLGTSGSTGINLTLGAGIATVSLTGAPSITVNGNAVDNVISVAAGADTVDGGTGTDRLVVDYHTDAGNVSTSIGLSGGPQDGFQGQYSDGTGNSARFFNIENFTVTTGSGSDSITTRSGDDIISLGDGNDFGRHRHRVGFDRRRCRQRHLAGR